MSFLRGASVAGLVAVLAFVCCAGQRVRKARPRGGGQAPSAHARHRGLYIALTGQDHGRAAAPAFPLESLRYILGDEHKEQRLLQFAARHGFKRLSLYRLRQVLEGQGRRGRLALGRFIASARRRGIEQLEAVVGGDRRFIDSVARYQASAAVEARFDSIVVEQEFWETGRLQPLIRTLDQLAGLGLVDRRGARLPIGVYLGWLHKKPHGVAPIEKARAIVRRVDYIYLHLYVSDPERAFDYGQSRLALLDRAARETGRRITVAPLFSAEGRTYTADRPFLGDWLRRRAATSRRERRSARDRVAASAAGPFADAEARFYRALRTRREGRLQALVPGAAQWYSYQFCAALPGTEGP